MARINNPVSRRLQRSRPLFGVAWVGLKEMQKGLALLEKMGYTRSVLDKAIKKASKPMVQKAKAEAPRGKGSKSSTDKDPFYDGVSLDKSIGVVKSTRKRRSEAKWIVTPSARNAHLIHDGTAMRIVKSTGRRVGRVLPDRFMDRAWEATKDEVFGDLEKQFGAELVKLGKRIYNKAHKGTLGKAAKKRLARL